jgi:glucokinase
MPLLGIDLGATKLAAAVFTDEGEMVAKERIALENRKGTGVAQLIVEFVKSFTSSHRIDSIGIAVPGISNATTGKVWAPNIPDWEDYPLLDQVNYVTGSIPVTIEGDRACYILGESWQGNAKGCRDAIFLAVGTGIGAGILADGRILRGANDISGAIGWMALDRPFNPEYSRCGCFEFHASGEGIAKVTTELIRQDNLYAGPLKDRSSKNLTAHDVFAAYDSGDIMAIKVIGQCIEFWAMAVANLVSVLNPEKIIFGGGVFGPALRFLPDIHKEAVKWAQPISIQKVELVRSRLEGDAGLFGAGFLALKNKNV